MPDFFIGTTPLSLKPADVVGKGGEADIYLKGTSAFKIFKKPSHPDFAGLPAEQHAAAERLKEHQTKLPAFPKGLPSHVIAPQLQGLIRDAKGFVAGYQMPFLANMEVLFRYTERDFRDQGIPDADVVAILADLHKTVEAIHKANVVIGDFNDLNVLVKGREAFFIDADSMQFGQYLTRVFTAKFVDPLICDPNARSPIMVAPHSSKTDWYAYMVMLMQLLLFVGPYGGVHMPQDPKKRIPPDMRVLKRLTVFDPEVRYPKPARPYGILPDALLDYFKRVFEKDLREIPPLSLIEALRFTTCTQCGAVHARSVCPSCMQITKAMEKEIVTGSVSATKLFDADGIILYATMQNGVLRYIYHEGNTYKREGKRVVFTGPLDPNMRFRIRGPDSVFARSSQSIVFKEDGSRESISVESYGLLPLIDANATRLFFAQNGALMRTGHLGYDYPERSADVLPNQTLFWVGDTLGFGFYRAAELSNYFVMQTERKGINDTVQLPPIRGQLIDSTCYFSDSRIWFFTSTKEGSQTHNRCYLMSADGKLLGEAEATPDDGSWLGTIRGKCAHGSFLMSPTDEGVVQVLQDGATISVTKQYSDTKRFVDSSSKLFLSKEGLLVVGRHDIWHLVIGAPQPGH